VYLKLSRLHQLATQVANRSVGNKGCQQNERAHVGEERRSTRIEQTGWLMVGNVIKTQLFEKLQPGLQPKSCASSSLTGKTVNRVSKRARSDRLLVSFTGLHGGMELSRLAIAVSRDSPELVATFNAHFYEASRPVVDRNYTS
jgi:hypothetical protein